jgi:hypothetical protein
VWNVVSVAADGASFAGLNCLCVRHRIFHGKAEGLLDLGDDFCSGDGDAVRLREFGGANEPDSAGRMQRRHYHRHVFEWRSGIARSGHDLDLVLPDNGPARPGFGLCRRYQFRARRMLDDLDGRLRRYIRSPTIAGERHRPQSGRALHAGEHRLTTVHARHHRRSVGIDYAGGTIVHRARRLVGILDDPLEHHHDFKRPLESNAFVRDRERLSIGGNLVPSGPEHLTVRL